MQRRFQYLHIDPMILDSLSINEERVNRIMSILHGQDPNEYLKKSKAMEQTRKRKQIEFNKMRLKQQNKRQQEQRIRDTIIQSYERSRFEKLKQYERKASSQQQGHLRRQIDNQKVRLKSQYEQTRDKNSYKTIEENIQRRSTIQRNRYQSQQKTTKLSQHYATIDVSSIKQKQQAKYQRYQLPNIPQRIKRNSIAKAQRKPQIHQHLNKNQVIKTSNQRPSSVVLIKQKNIFGQQRKEKTQHYNKKSIIDDNPYSRTVQQEIMKAKRMIPSERKQTNKSINSKINFSSQYERLIPQVDYNFSMNKQKRKPYLRDNKVYMKKKRTQKLSNKNSQQILTNEERQQQVKKQYSRKKKLKSDKNNVIQKKNIDIYRQQIENLVSRRTSVQDMEKAQIDMQILKKTYSYLKKFDKKHFSQLNKQQFDIIS